MCFYLYYLYLYISLYTCANVICIKLLLTYLLTYYYLYSQSFCRLLETHLFAEDRFAYWLSFLKRLMNLLTFLLFCVVRSSSHKETNRRSPSMSASKTTGRASGGRCSSSPYRTVRLTLRFIRSTTRNAILASSRGSTTTRCWTSPRDTCRSSQTTTATTKNGT